MQAERRAARLPLSSKWVGSFFYLGFFLSAGSFAPFLNVYFTDLGLTGQQVGLLATLTPVFTLLLATPVSALADRKRMRVRIAQIAITGWAVSIYFLGIPRSFAAIALLMVPLTISFSPIIGIADSLVARMARRKSLNYGSMRLWGSIGFASSAFLFGAVWENFGFQWMFLVSALLALPLVWMTGRLEEGPPQEQSVGGSAADLARDSALVLLLVATFLASISNSLAMTFEGIYIRSLGGGNFLIGMMIAFSAFSELPTMFFSQRIGERMKGIGPILLAYSFSALAYTGYLLFPNASVLPVFAIFKGLGFGLFLTSTIRLLTDRAPEKWASTAQSLMSVGMFGLAPLVAGPLGGWIHDRVSPGAVFGLGIFTLVLAALVLSFSNLRSGSIPLKES